MNSLINENNIIIAMALLAPILFVLIVIVLNSALTTRPRRRY